MHTYYTYTFIYIHMIHIWFQGCQLPKFGASCCQRFLVLLVHPVGFEASYAYINTTSNDFLGRTWQAHGPMRTVETC